jgi:hypothetical protein
MRKLISSSVLGAVALASTPAFAWFDICNLRADGADMYVTYAYFEPKTTTLVADSCSGSSSISPPQYYTAWRNTGWWHLNKNQCTRVYGPAISNRYAYVYAQISDGSSLPNANVPFTVTNAAFGLDQYPNGPFGSCSGECVGQSAAGDCASPAPSYYSVNTVQVDQGNYSNFVVTIQ